MNDRRFIVQTRCDDKRSVSGAGQGSSGGRKWFSVVRSYQRLRGFDGVHLRLRLFSLIHAPIIFFYNATVALIRVDLKAQSQFLDICS